MDKQYDWMAGQFATPKAVTALVAELARRIQARRLLDPACGTADLLLSVGESHPDSELTGIDIMDAVLSQARTNAETRKRTAHLLCEDFLAFDTATLGQFDLVLCNPPFGARMQATVDGSRVASGEAAFLLKGIGLLREGGYCIFVVPEGILFNSTLQVVRDHIITHHSLEAVVSLPPGLFGPYTGIKTSVLMVRRTNQRPRVFFAECAEALASQTISSNYWTEKENKNPSQGRWVALGDVVAAGGTWTYGLVRANEDAARMRRESKYPVVPLSELVCSVPTRTDAPPPDRTLLIQAIGIRPKVFLASDAALVKVPKGVLTCAITDERALPQYLRLYLNSTRGNTQLQSLVAGVIPSIRLRDLNLVQVELPDIETQAKILAVQSAMVDVQATVESLSQQFHADIFAASRLRPIVDRYVAVDEKDVAFEKLVWPLATSYRIATKGSPNISAQLDAYFKMFELLAAFNSITLLSALTQLMSGLPTEMRKAIETDIWATEKLKYVKTSMGLWVALYRRLANACGKLPEEAKAVLPFGREFYSEMCHQEILSALDLVPQRRNKMGGSAHGGVTPEILAKKEVAELHPILQKAFSRVLSALSPLRLVYPESMRKNDGLYTIKAKVLEGTHYRFAEEEVQTETDMNTDRLYLVGAGRLDRVELLNEFVKLVQCEKCGHWSIFFFSKTDTKRAGYISYQNEIHDYSCEPAGILQSFMARV